MAEIVGQRVSLHSLKGRPELNGCEGVAISFDSTTGRLGIRVDGEDKPLALKPENLTSDGNRQPVRPRPRARETRAQR